MRLRTRIALPVVAVLALVQPARAQTAGDGFLFRRPTGTFTLRGGFDRAIADGDLFDNVIHELTLNRSDFFAYLIGAEASVRIASGLDLVLGASYAGVRKGSEFRDWWDQDSLPIEQTTSLVRAPITLSLRAYLAPRGRAVGQFVWIPARLVPFVGVGGGTMYYRFRQKGDFVDFRDLHVFPGDLDKSAWTATAHAFAGVEMTLGPRFFLTGEGRYTWARAPFDGAFSEFGRVDLSGVSLTAGIGYRN